MFKFIRYFIMEWKCYPTFKAYSKRMKEKYPEDYKEWEKSDAERGIKPIRNRLDYAFKIAKLHCAGV